MYTVKVKLVLSVHSNRTVVITTIHRSAFTRLKRYFRVFPAPGVEGTKHSPLRTVAIVSTARTVCFVGSAACGTTLRLIGKAFRLEELLFPSAESEGSPTIGTLDRFVLKTHWMTSFLRNFSWNSGHPILDIDSRGL